MPATVEPIEGPELDRLITALLNATGTVHQVLQREIDAPGPGGLAIIDRAATRLRAALSIFAEHREDGELSVITEFLALTSILIAQDGGFEDVFFKEFPDVGDAL